MLPKSKLPERGGRVPWVADVEGMKKREEGRRYAADDAALSDCPDTWLVVVVSMLV